MAQLPLSEMVIGGYWTDGSYQQRSALGNVASKVWVKYIGKYDGRIWLHPKNEAFNTMVIVEGGPNSDGFGGRTLPFNMDDGSVLQLKGPWSASHDEFFKQTGIDRREHYNTWGCIGRHRGHHSNPRGYDSRTVICDLVYFDSPEGAIGGYDRIRDIARAMAAERDEVLFMHSATYGGSSSGPVFPYEGSDWYKEYSTNHARIDFREVRAKQDVYWDRYKAEFGDSSLTYKLPEEPLDDSEYEPIPVPPKTIESVDDEELDYNPDEEGYY